MARGLILGELQNYGEKAGHNAIPLYTRVTFTE